jgi:hypothetical protein
MLLICDAQIFPYLRDTIDEVFDALDGYHNERLPDFLYILEAMVQSFHRWDVPTSTPVDDPDSEDTTNAGLAASVVKPVSLDWRAVVTRVLDRCSHLLGSPQPRVRLLVLDIIVASVAALERHEDHLLPAINGVWPPLTARFDDVELVVRSRSLEVVDRIIAAAPSFMGSRIGADVIPTLLAWARSSTLHTVTPVDTTSLLKFSVGFRHERALLRTFRRVLPTADLAREQGTELAEACLPYLASHCPDELQQDAVAVFEALIDRDPDGVWYILARACAPQLPAPPDSRFSRPSFPPPTLSCKANVDALLLRLSQTAPQHTAA